MPERLRSPNLIKIIVDDVINWKMNLSTNVYELQQILMRLIQWYYLLEDINTMGMLIYFIIDVFMIVCFGYNNNNMISITINGNEIYVYNPIANYFATSDDISSFFNQTSVVSVCIFSCLLSNYCCNCLVFIPCYYLFYHLCFKIYGCIGIFFYYIILVDIHFYNQLDDIIEYYNQNTIQALIWIVAFIMCYYDMIISTTILKYHIYHRHPDFDTDLCLQYSRAQFGKKYFVWTVNNYFLKKTTYQQPNDKFVKIDISQQEQSSLAIFLIRLFNYIFIKYFNLDFKKKLIICKSDNFKDDYLLHSILITKYLLKYFENNHQIVKIIRHYIFEKSNGLQYNRILIKCKNIYQWKFLKPTEKALEMQTLFMNNDHLSPLVFALKDWGVIHSQDVISDGWLYTYPIASAAVQRERMLVVSLCEDSGRELHPNQILNFMKYNEKKINKINHMITAEPVQSKQLMLHAQGNNNNNNIEISSPPLSICIAFSRANRVFNHYNFRNIWSSYERKHCAVCKRVGNKHCKLKICKRCKMTLYCSKLCQKRDWNFGDHHTKCKKIVADRNNLKDVAF